MSGYKNTFVDYLGKEIVVNWSKSLWNYHLCKHPELKNFQNTDKLIKKALENPNVVMYCSGHTNTKNEELYCYYFEVKRYQQLITYIKVVVGCKSRPAYIKSVWQQQALFILVIKEKKYPYFKEIWKSQNSYL